MSTLKNVPGIAIAVSLLALTACTRSPSAPTPEPRPIATEALSGNVALPADITLPATGLVAVTFADSAAVAADGSFAVDTPQSATSQMVFLCGRETGRPVFLGVRAPDKGAVTVSDSTTALALALMTPFLAEVDESARHDYIVAVTTSPRFATLRTRLREAYARDAASALDYEVNPGVYQDTAELIQEVMASLGGKAGASLLEPAPPTIRDAEGQAIEFVNARHVSYGAGIYENDGDLRDVVMVERVKKVVSVQWGWPPLVVSEPAVSSVDLPDGDYRIHLAKGLDFSVFGNANDPAGLATRQNTYDGICYLVQFVAGHVKLPSLATLSNGLHVSANFALQLGCDIRNHDSGMFVVHFAKLMADNADDIAFMFWNSGDPAAVAFIDNAAWLIDNVATALRIVALGNEQGPFFWDLVLAQGAVDYTVRQAGGVVVELRADAPPTAEFTISPRSGIVGTPFALTPDGTVDDHDAPTSLLYRWDWESDGVWDVSWGGGSSLVHAYTQSGAYQVTMEARDTAGLVGSVVHTINVGGGAGTANHVKIFRDNIAWVREDYPWTRDALVEVLAGLGIEPGAGYHQYEVLPSTDMGTAPLVPGADLVIISNDQAQGFYDHYAANQVRFSAFVANGGSLLWEACDEGWADGSMANAGVVLPCGIRTRMEYCYQNYVVSPSLPLVAGLPTTMDHNYASHEGLVSVPDNATIYCVDDYWMPTLVEFNFGRGWVMVTGQPLEHQYRAVYGAADMEQLLPRIIAYFVGGAAADVARMPVPRERNVSSAGAASAGGHAMAGQPGRMGMRPARP